MNDDRYLSEVVYGQLEKGLPVVLASIVSMEGSTPRKSGTKMVVAADGKTYGTVGGGLLEAAVIIRSKRALAERRSDFMDFDLAESNASSGGMICGGHAVLLLDVIPPTAKNLELFRQIRGSILSGKTLYYIVSFTESGDAVDVTGHYLLLSDGTTIGDGNLATPDISGLRAELHIMSSTAILTIGGKRFIIDPIRKLKTLFCFGAGHVAVPTAHVAAMVGFEVVVVDDRSEFANSERFPDAGRVEVIEDFRRALVGLEIDRDSFIVIVTRGHEYDHVVLQQALQTAAGYIGMIGSRSKRDTIYRELIANGAATAKDLERVHCPIGLPIGGEAPEEIAISIVAEMIAEREKQ